MLDSESRRDVTAVVRLADRFLQAVADLLGAVLLVYTVRRAVLVLAGMLGSSSGPTEASSSLPDVLVLSACRNESGQVDGLCTALANLVYPTEKLHVVLIDDGSNDSTGAVMQTCIEGRQGWEVLRLPQSSGKAAALNMALRYTSFGEIVYVIDADHRPDPEALLRIVKYFSEPSVAGVTGRTIPRNPLASLVAYYAAIETAIHQLVTMRGKDRLDLGPALLGSNCAYRRSALLERDGFRPGALLEDYDATLSLYCQGYRVRFAEDAVAWHEVPETVGGYLEQHTRWGRGFHDVTRRYAARLIRASNMPWPLRLELLLSAAGYVDRLALVGTALLALLSTAGQPRLKIRYRILIAALVAPLVQIVLLLAGQRAPRAFWIRLPCVPVLLLIDILAATRSFVDTIRNRPRTWTKTMRCARSEPPDGVTGAPPMSPMAVVVISYNTRTLLRECLESVVAELPSELVVVDNASGDGSADMVVSSFPDAILVGNTQNIGFASAANRGIRAVASPYILLLNGDTRLPPGSLRELATYLWRHPSVAVVGPKLRDAIGRSQASERSFPAIWDLLLDWTHMYALIEGIPYIRESFPRTRRRTGARSVPWVLGAALAIRRTAFEDVGGFDPDFFLYYEEVDLCYRLRRAGWQVHFSPGVEVVHVGGASASQRPTETMVQAFRGLAQFYDRHYAGWRRRSLDVLLPALASARLVRDGVRWRLTDDPGSRSTLARNISAWKELQRGEWQMPAAAGGGTPAE